MRVRFYYAVVEGGGELDLRGRGESESVVERFCDALVDMFGVGAVTAAGGKQLSVDRKGGGVGDVVLLTVRDGVGVGEGVGQRDVLVEGESDDFAARVRGEDAFHGEIAADAGHAAGAGEEFEQNGVACGGGWVGGGREGRGEELFVACVLICDQAGIAAVVQFAIERVHLSAVRGVESAVDLCAFEEVECLGVVVILDGDFGADRVGVIHGGVQGESFVGGLAGFVEFAFVQEDERLNAKGFGLVLVVGGEKFFGCGWRVLRLGVHVDALFGVDGLRGVIDADGGEVFG